MRVVLYRVLSCRVVVCCAMICPSVVIDATFRGLAWRLYGYGCGF